MARREFTTRSTRRLAAAGLLWAIARLYSTATAFVLRVVIDGQAQIAVH
ncbi:MAG TPA: hypothetical protein VGM50_11830 [Gemmatimonadaceae bacterium]